MIVESVVLRPGRLIGADEPCFIIAEAGVNHNGDLGMALRLVRAAAEANADAIKFQVYQTEELVAETAPTAPYQAQSTGEQNQRRMLDKLRLDRSELEKVANSARDHGITFLATPFDVASADLLQKLHLPAYKIGSGDLTNLPLLKHVARKGKPVILSTGMATMDEVTQAVACVSDAGNPPLVLLHCVSLYPTEPRQANLRAMEQLADRFDIPVGFSDHTRGATVPIAAAALGAQVIEKHLTLDRTMEGPDHSSSMEPEDFKAMVQAIHEASAARGHGKKEPMEGEAEIARVARRSIVTAVDIPEGTRLTREHLAIKRPGTGIAPSRLEEILGRKLTEDLARDTVLEEGMLE